MKSNRITRIVRILTTLQAGKNYTADDLAKIFRISRRTVFRDLKELQTIGVPYQYKTKTGGYAIDPEFFLPPIDLNLKEALSLFLLAHKAGKHIQLPFKSSALLAALKIENNLPANLRKYCNTTLQNISTKAAPQAPTNLLDNTFAQLQKATVKKRKVCLHYLSLFENKPIKLQLSPYHLFYNHRAWYVIGFSSMHKSIRTFKLNRIKELLVLDKCFVNDNKFDLYEYLDSAWSMIPEGRIYNIKLLFLPMVANNVAEVHWHSTQKVTYNNNGSVTMEFRVNGLNEITWWILGYGDQVRILAPKILRKKIVQTAKNTIKLNE